MGNHDERASGPRLWSPASHQEHTRNSIAAASSATQPTLRAFAAWLASERGLGAGSITVRVHSARWVLEKIVKRAPSGSIVRATRALTAERIEALFVEYCKSHGAAARRSMRSAMRLWLRFSCERGWIRACLIDAVPSLRRYRLSTVPRGLPDEDLSRLMGSVARADTPSRDRAIVLLVAMYGVRRAQLSDLRISDIDWNARTVVFRAHKRGKTVQHVLSATAADALARYLRYERPPADSDFVFLRVHPPHVRIGPTAITDVIYRCTTKAGLRRWGPHSLRHAFAARLLATGQSFKTIADLLGHRSLGSVAIYAKLDYRRLLEVASEWPEARS